MWICSNGLVHLIEFYYVAGPPPDPLRGMPFVAAPIPPPAMYFTAPDPQLHSKIVNQIDYYFRYFSLYFWTVVPHIYFLSTHLISIFWKR